MTQADQLLHLAVACGEMPIPDGGDAAGEPECVVVPVVAAEGVRQTRHEVEAGELDPLRVRGHLDIWPDRNDEAVLDQHDGGARRDHPPRVRPRLHGVDGGADEGDGFEKEDVHGDNGGRKGPVRAPGAGCRE